MTTSSRGMLFYTSQMDGKRMKFSTKTDMWAFGVTMWEIYTLAKDIPYEDIDTRDLIYQYTDCQ